MTESIQYVNAAIWLV